MVLETKVEVVGVGLMRAAECFAVSGCCRLFRPLENAKAFEVDVLPLGDGLADGMGDAWCIQRALFVPVIEIRCCDALQGLPGEGDSAT